MKPTVLPSHLLREAARLSAIVALNAAVCSSSSAQAVATSGNIGTVGDDVSDEVIRLSPFVATTDEDQGYGARDTLAGTRIRTRLEDVGASISVITKQFLEDTNSNAIESLLVYTSNTEVSAEGGNFLGKGDTGILTTPPSTATRVRGLTGADTTRDLYLTSIPFDSYNTGRLDIQRGPNSILFGIGSAGGIVNTSINQAAFRDSNSVGHQFGSFGTQRFTGDFNKVLIKDELAVRLSFLNDSRKYRQDPTFRDDERVFAALQWRPRFLKFESARTTLRANFEKGQIDSNIPRQTPPIDRVSPFFDGSVRALNGTRLGNPRATSSSIYYNGNSSNYFQTHGGNSSNAGAAVFDNSGFNYAFYSQYTNAAGTVFGANNFYRQMGLASTAEIAQRFGARWFATLGDYKSASLTDRSMFDFYNHLLEGPNKSEWNDFKTYNITLEQTFFNDKLGFELGYDRQKNFEGRQAIFNDLTYALTVDLNTELPHGAPNPHAGELVFVSSGGNNRWMDRDRESLRATVFGELNFNDIAGRDSLLGKIFGRNVFTALLTRQNLSQFDGRYTNGGALPEMTRGNYARPNNASYSGGYYYWGYIGSPNMDTLASPSGLWLGGLKSLMRLPAGGTTYQARNLSTLALETVPFAVYQNLGLDFADMTYTSGSSNKTWERIDSQAAVWQGYWFGGTVVPMVGLRRDKQIATNAGGAPQNTPANFYGTVYDIFNPGWYAPRSPDDLTRITFRGTAPSYRTTEVDSKTYSLVLHLPERIRRRLPGQTGVSALYNRSENIRPMANRRDIVGTFIENPKGKTEEFGLNISTLDDRLTLRITRYETLVSNDSASGSLNPNFGRIAQVEATGRTIAYQQKLVGQTGNPAGYQYADTIYGRASNGFFVTWRPDGELLSDFSQYTQAQIDATAAKQQAAIDGFLAAPTTDAFIAAWGLQDYNGLDATNPNLARWSSISPTATVDTRSEGYEIELIARPVRGWDISCNIAKTQAIRTNLAGSFAAYIESRWQTFQGAAGALRLEGADLDAVSPHNGVTARSRYLTDVMSSYFFFRATEGAKVPELRPWSANLTTNYSFQGGFLKNVRVGGSLRWADRTSIGFLGTTIDGVDTFDVAHPVKGPAQTQVDLSVSYSRKLTHQIKWRLQLNVRNVFADDDLIPVTVQPDGRLAGFRIPEPTTYAIRNTFEF